MKTGMYIGRFQPFHDGHKACVEEILKTNDVVHIIVRKTKQDEKNPFSLADRHDMIRKVFPDTKRVQIHALEDEGCDLTVYKGRDVGWKLEEIKLTPEIEAISATKIRKEMGI